MQCVKCNLRFDPKENLKLGHGDGDCAEVLTSCTRCGMPYYTFTLSTWHEEEHPHAKIKENLPALNTKCVSGLNKGDRVIIYEDPITKTKPEGTAVLKTRRGPDDAEQQNWLVHFEGDDARNVERLISHPWEVLL